MYICVRKDPRVRVNNLIFVNFERFIVFFYISKYILSTYILLLQGLGLGLLLG